MSTLPVSSITSPPDPVTYQSDWDAFRAACEQAGIPLLVLSLAVPPPDLRGLWSIEEARQFGAVPAGLEDDHLTVAMADPRNQQTVTALESRTGYRVFPVLARAADLQAAITRMS